MRHSFNLLVDVFLRVCWGYFPTSLSLRALPFTTECYGTSLPQWESGDWGTSYHGCVLGEGGRFIKRGPLPEVKHKRRWKSTSDSIDGDAFVLGGDGEGRGSLTTCLLKTCWLKSRKWDLFTERQVVWASGGRVSRKPSCLSVTVLFKCQTGGVSCFVSASVWVTGDWFFLFLCLGVLVSKERERWFINLSYR